MIDKSSLPDMEGIIHARRFTQASQLDYFVFLYPVHERDGVLYPVRFEEESSDRLAYFLCPEATLDIPTTDFDLWMDQFAVRLLDNDGKHIEKELNHVG